MFGKMLYILKIQLYLCMHFNVVMEMRAYSLHSFSECTNYLLLQVIDTTFENVKDSPCKFF